MDITITFTELSKYISEHYGKILTFEKVSENELRILYSQNLFIKTIQVPVNITIDGVRHPAVCITYNGGFGVDMMIAGALTFMKAKLPELTNVIVSREGHRLIIDLSQLSQTKALVDNVRLNEILVRDDRLEIKAALR